MSSVTRNSLLIVAFFLFVVAGCSDDGSPDVHDAGDASQVDTGVDAVVDANVDATGLPVVIPHDFCALPMFKLPIDGHQEETLGLSLWGERVAYSKRPAGEPGSVHEVHMVDFLACNEYRLTEGANASLPHIHDENIVWVDLRPLEEPGNDSCSAIYWYDFSDWQEVRVLEDALCYKYAKTNGDHIVYQRATDESLLSFDTRSYQISTNETDVLVQPEGQGIYYDINDAHIVWAATTEDPSTIGRDVFYYDLATKTSTHIDSTFDQFQMSVVIWGEHIVWSNSDTWLNPPYHLVLHQMGTGQEVSLTQNDGASTYAAIHKNLVAYTTTKHLTNGGLDLFPADVELFDINTGQSRRLTTESGTLRASKIFFPWLIVLDYLGLGNSNTDFYAIHLVRSNITDDQGNLLAGSPVISPPTR